MIDDTTAEQKALQLIAKTITDFTIRLQAIENYIENPDRSLKEWRTLRVTIK